MIACKPGEAVVALLDGALTGLVGTLTIDLKTQAGVSQFAPTTVGITAITIEGVATGGYTAKFTAPVLQGQYLITWTNGSTLYYDDLYVLKDGARVPDATYTVAGEQFVARGQEFAAGRANIVRAGVIKLDNTLVVVPVTITVVETYTGKYEATIPEIDAQGQYTIVWHDGTEYYHDVLWVGPWPEQILNYADL